MTLNPCNTFPATNLQTSPQLGTFREIFRFSQFAPDFGAEPQRLFGLTSTARKRARKSNVNLRSLSTVCLRLTFFI